jgi:hypothetical protein
VLALLLVRAHGLQNVTLAFGSDSPFCPCRARSLVEASELVDEYLAQHVAEENTIQGTP